MAAVNKVDIKKSIIKSFADFSDVFVDWILDESFGYNEVRVIFDHYLKGSLKTQTTIWRTDDYFTVYGVHDETKIGNLKTKEFLSSIKTKKDLTVFLSKKLASVLSDRSIRHITMYNTTCDTNVPMTLLCRIAIRCNYCFTRNWCDSTKSLFRSYNIQYP